LHVYHATIDYPLKVESGDTIAGIQLKDSSGEYGHIYTKNSKLYLSNIANADEVVINNGNVGIGTTEPESLLEISKARAPEVRISSSDDTSYSLLRFNTDEGVAKYIIGYGSAHSQQPSQLSFKNEYGAISFMAGGTSYPSALRMIITSNGNVGIGTTSPGYKLDVSGDIHCTGKLTSDGGNDPPYVLYNYETRASIIDRIKKEVLPDKLNGAVLFFNGARGQLEIFLPGRGEFRTLDGEVLEIVEPITRTFETEDRYYLDEETGEIKSYTVKKPSTKYRLKPDHELNPLTGKVMRKIKEKRKNPETGEEIEEVVGEEEVALEESLELIVNTDGRIGIDTASPSSSSE